MISLLAATTIDWHGIPLGKLLVGGGSALLAVLAGLWSVRGRIVSGLSRVASATVAKPKPVDPGSRTVIPGTYTDAKRDEVAAGIILGGQFAHDTKNSDMAKAAVAMFEAFVRPEPDQEKP